MKHLKAGFIVTILIVGAVFVYLQHQAQEKLRATNESLTQQIAQLRTDNGSLSNQLAAAGDSQSLLDKQMNELLKLRGEVGVLRRQANEVGKLQAENQRLREAEAKLQVSNASMETISVSAKFKANEVEMINTMKQLGLAERIYAGDHNDQYATTFDQMANELGGLYKNPLLDNIEFVNAGLVNETMPDKIIFRERVARRTPDGTWERVYGLADGSVQTQFSSNGNFEAYEQQHMISPQNQ